MEWSQVRVDGGGTLRFREEGDAVRFEVFGAADTGGLYKVILRGASGNVPLGTLCPGQGGPELTRRISKRQLERWGCWPVTGGERVRCVSFERAGLWQREMHPERLVGDEVLRESLKGRGMLLKRQSDGFCLAGEMEPGRPFPLTALFCLARVCIVDGKQCAVFWFDEEGTPILPRDG